MAPGHIGEFEQVVLLAILQAGDEAYAPNIRAVIHESAGRSVSRGALYRTFDRMAAKGLLEWEAEGSNPVPERGGAPMRRFTVTAAGRRALRVSREALLTLWDGIEPELEDVR
ncbi:MAG: PadR family transcriptional regulator [Acidobacteria bacterium]|nr:PadR family transcriptional regulator [Acidobacteriota bacterium]